MINITVDYDKVNETLKKRKKKNKSFEVRLSEKTHGESSSKTRGIEDPLAAVETVPTMASDDGIVPPCPQMPVTPVHGEVVDRDRFHFSSIVSSLEQTFGGLDYDLDNFMAGVMEIFIIVDVASTSSPTWHEKSEKLGRQPRSGSTQG